MGYAKHFIVLGVSVALFTAMSFTGLIGGDGMPWVLVCLCALMVCATEYLLYKIKPRKAMGEINIIDVLFCSLLLASAFFVRCIMMGQISGDYVLFLSPWMQSFRENGGFQGLSMPIGNYNVPYLYFLAAFSYIPLYDLFLIKLLSIIFDIALAAAIMNLTFRACGKHVLSAVAFIAALLLPTIWANSAYWAQCDSIYAALALTGLFFCLSGRPLAGAALFGLSFSFKLQAVFLMPILLILMLCKRVKIWHLLAMPVCFAVAAAPAAILGRPISDIFMIYVNQANDNTSLTLNAPSIYALLPGSAPYQVWKWVGITMAAVFLLCISRWALAKKEVLTEQIILTISYMFCLAIPWLLPSMHERYFYLADAMGIVYALTKPKVRGFVALAALFGSISSYCNCIFHEPFVLDLRICSLLIFASILFLVFDLNNEFQRQAGLPRLSK